MKGPRAPKPKAKEPPKLVRAAAPKRARAAVTKATAKRPAGVAPKKIAVPRIGAVPTPLETAPRSARAPSGPSLDWDDGVMLAEPTDELVARWARKGEELVRLLEAHGAGKHEYRADLKQGRFVWLGPDGHVSAEARAEVVCSWSRPTGVIAMAWVDPLVRPVGIGPIEGMAAERDGVDEETAWRVAIQAAEVRAADYLHRVPTPHAWYFLALRDLTFEPRHPLFSPGTPVGLVLHGLSETRTAVSSRAEPSELLRERLEAVGRELLGQADYAYRDTDWVSRLVRTGRHLLHLAGRIPRPTFSAVAAGRGTDDWIDEDTERDLSAALTLLEDEWQAFA